MARAWIVLAGSLACVAPLAGQDGATLRLTIRVRYLEGNNVPATLRGMIWLDSQAGGWDGSFEGTGGRAEVVLPGPGCYVLELQEVDGVEFPGERWRIDVVGDRDHVLRVPPPRTVTLAFVDREGTPVAGAAVRPARSRPSPDEARYPSPEELAAEPRRADAQGRLVLGPGYGTELVLVQAPVCAWKTLEVPLAAGGELKVRLEPGGGLRLKVDRWSELEDARVWMLLHEPRRWVALPGPGPDGEILLEALPAGSCDLFVRRGDSPSSGHLYGEAHARVSAGKTKDLILATEPLPRTTRAAIHGRVTVPRSWRDREDLILGVRGVDSNNSHVDPPLIDVRASGEDPVPFRVEGLPPGRYQVDLYPLPWGRVVTVPEGGCEVDLAVPEPVDLRVRVVDRAGAGIPGATVWCLYEAEGATFHNGRQVECLPGAGLRLQVPPGRIELRTQARGYLDRSLEISCRGGEDREAVIEMERSAVLIVRLTLDGRPYAGDGVSVLLDRDLSSRGDRVADGKARFDLEPGPWRLTLEVPAGIGTPQPREVDLIAGETTEVVVDLVRHG